MTDRPIFAVVLPFLLSAIMAGCAADISPTPTAISTSTPTIEPTPDYAAQYATWQADPCSPPSDLSVDGMATANVFIWLDYNGNGEVDDGEPPLGGFPYWKGMTEARTGPDGIGSFEEFKPGCPCNCWEDVKINIDPPQGFEPTTPSSYELKGQDEMVKFGFRVKVNHVPFPGEPEWYTTFYDHGLQLTDFHYDGQGRIEATFSPVGLNSDQLHSAIFDVLAILVNDQKLPITQLNIKYNNSNVVQRCDVAKVLENRADKASADLVTAYCPSP